MKRIIFSIGLFILAPSAYAQKTIAVLSGTNWTFYDDFSPALRAAPAGSVIYLPGGTFTISDGVDTINKQLTIIGVGFSMDSANATGITRLIGSLVLDNGADYTTIEGIRIDGIGLLNGNSIYNNLFFRRCHIGSLSFAGNYSITNYGKNYYVTESVICELNGGSVPFWGYYFYNNLKVEKSIIFGSVNGCYGSVFDNNILNCNPNCGSCQNNLMNGYCEFNNNIFIDSSYSFEISINSTFNNNIFRVSNSNWGNNGNVYTVCVWNKLPSAIFINPPAAGYGCDAVYNTQYNFHLKSTSPAKNFGTDGTDAGIYGTSTPCKEGWVPSNPHISAKTIGPSSLSNGTLPVNIKVIAQDR